MSRWEPPTCRWCEQEIVWRRHYLTGTSAPLEASEDGPLILVADGQYRALKGGEYRFFEGSRFVNHLVVCPNARAREAEARRLHEVQESFAGALPVRHHEPSADQQALPL